MFLNRFLRSPRVASVIVNYNMPERADQIVKSIARNCEWGVDLIVVDNGSDLKPPSEFSALRLPLNVQTTRGWLAGLKLADIFKESWGREYLAYNFIITSAEFPYDQDVIGECARSMYERERVTGVHPALTKESTTAWNHMKKRGVEGECPLRQTWMIDNICSMWRSDWFDSIGRFDAKMTFAWGIDLETCFKARKEGRGIYIHEGVNVSKDTNIGYRMERMGMSSEEREMKARNQMSEVLQSKYGEKWNYLMRESYIEENMK